MRANSIINRIAIKGVTAFATSGMLLNLSLGAVSEDRLFQDVREAKPATVYLQPDSIDVSGDIPAEFHATADAASTVDIQHLSKLITDSNVIANNVNKRMFYSLKDRWFNDQFSHFSSSTDDFIKTDSFHELVNLGEQIVPFILEDLNLETAIRWNLVLGRIYQHSIVPQREQGRPGKIVERWSKFLSKLT
jgi:hypothetical protein